MCNNPSLARSCQYQCIYTKIGEILLICSKGIEQKHNYDGLTDGQRELELSKNLTIAPLQRFACSKKAKFLKISSGNVIRTSIRGHNSGTNLQKMTANNPNIDLVSINSYKVWSKSVHLFSRY